MHFTGRSRELGILGRQLDDVRAGADGRRGRALLLKGRRRIGKTRLAQEFCARSGVPYVFYQATRSQPAPMARRALFEAVAEAEALPARRQALADAGPPVDWLGTLKAIATVLPDRPSILVLDEIPWLVEADPLFDASLKTAWDMHLSAKPVLLLLVGSDLAMLDRLTSYDHPFYGRAREYTIGPLTPPDVQQITGLDAAAALDAYLITGGFPGVATSWRTGEPAAAYLTRQLDDPASVLLTTGERSLAAEFPPRLQASRVLRAIGSGDRTFSAIATSSGGASGRPLAHGTLTPILAELMAAKRIIAADEPLSTQSVTELKRYRIADTYLRFWLAHLDNATAQADAGLGAQSLTRIRRAWPSWRRRAIEPLIRESLHRLMPDGLFPETERIGGWWNGQSGPEIDLVGTDRAPLAREVHFAGAIKWLADEPFGPSEYANLARDARAVPGVGADTPLVAVSRRGFAAGLPLTAAWGPEDLLSAWAR
jgi:AAA+ ATPase superfamily predicted ATPase